MLQKPTFLCGECGQRFRVVPTGVAHLDDARILDELAQQAVEIFAIQRSVFERNRELDEQRAEPAFGGEDVEAFAGAGFVFVGGTNARRRKWAPSWHWESG